MRLNITDVILLDNMDKKNTCKKGYSCGSACINMAYRCTEKLANKASTLTDNYIKLARTAKDNKLNTTKGKKQTTDTILANVANASTFEDLSELDENFANLANIIQNGIDEGSIGEEQLEAISALYSSTITKPIADRTGSKLMPLDSIETFIENTDIADKLVNAYEASFDESGKFSPKRPNGISQFVEDEVKIVPIKKELAEAVLNTLPNKTANKLKKAGDPREGYWDGTFDENNVPNMTNAGNTERNIALVQRYLEQKGIDPYDKKFVHFKDAELEHIVPDSKGEGRADQPDNYAWISSANNKSHDSDTAREWVDRLKASIQDKEQFKKDFEIEVGKANEKASAAKSAGNKTEKLFAIEDKIERQKFAKQLAKSMKTKAKKLLSSAGTKESYKELRPTLPKLTKTGDQAIGFNHRTKSIDEGSTVVKAQYADVLGNQNPSSLVIQTLAYLKDDPETFDKFVGEYEAIMFKRQIEADEVYELIDAGEPGNIDVKIAKQNTPKFRAAADARNAQFGKDLLSLLQNIEGLNFDI